MYKLLLQTYLIGVIGNFTPLLIRRCKMSCPVPTPFWRAAVNLILHPVALWKKRRSVVTVEISLMCRLTCLLLVWGLIILYYEDILNKQWRRKTANTIHTVRKRRHRRFTVIAWSSEELLTAWLGQYGTFVWNLTDCLYEHVVVGFLGHVKDQVMQYDRQDQLLSKWVSEWLSVSVWVN